MLCPFVKEKPHLLAQVRLDHTMSCMHLANTKINQIYAKIAYAGVYT